MLVVTWTLGELPGWKVAVASRETRPARSIARGNRRVADVWGGADTDLALELMSDYTFAEKGSVSERRWDGITCYLENYIGQLSGKAVSNCFCLRQLSRKTLKRDDGVLFFCL